MSSGTGRAASSNLIDQINNQKGSIMLEFVFTITILMVIFLATVTFSFLYGDYYGAQKVAKEGSREASISGDAEWARTKALEAAWLWGLDPDRVSVDFNTDSTKVTCNVGYIAKPFNKTFPTLLQGSPIQDVHIHTQATYAWSDTR